MFRSLHRQDKPQEKKLLSDGYMSDPEVIRKEKLSPIMDDKNWLLTTSIQSQHISNDAKNALNHHFPAAKSSYIPYSHKPWIISDYETGYSSLADTEAPYENRRHLHPLISPKPKYVCNDGYESDSTLIHKTGTVHEFDPQEQKQWYQEIQRGGDIPVHGLCKQAPEKRKEPVVGPPPPLPAKWDADYCYKVYSTTETDPYRNEASMQIVNQSANNCSQETLPKLQDDFRSKLDEVLLSQQENNLRYSPRKSPVETSQLNSRSQNTSPSSSPVCPYKVTVLYDFEAQTSRELSVKKGDVVKIRRKIDKNWLEGEHHGSVGILPISYIELASTESFKRTTAETIEGSACAKYDFIAQNSVELTLHKDDVITLVRQVDNNWYEGKLNGKSGIFPVCYVEVISEPRHSATSPQPSTVCSIKNQIANDKDSDTQVTEVHNKECNDIREIKDRNESVYSTKTVTYNQEGNKVIPFKALYPYKPQNDDELQLEEGDIIYVVEKCDDGWFVGTSMRTGFFGTFPGNYVEKI